MNLLSPSYGLTWLLYIMQTSVPCPGKEVKIKHWSLGRQFILFPENLKRFEGIKINCFSRDQWFVTYISWNFWSWKFIKPLCNCARQPTFAGNSALLPSDVIDFAMFLAQRFWRETVSFWGFMWPRRNQRERTLWKKNSSYNNCCC